MEPNNEIEKNEWDFFIAHSHKDKDLARELYECIIKNDSTAFLDQASIELGTYWDIEIPKAQKLSHVTIALISGNVREAHYARDEIHTAINLARTTLNRHKVIPVYINDALEDSSEIVYGLRLIQGIKLSSIGNVKNLAKLLCDDFKKLKLDDKTMSDAQTSHILLSYPTGPLVEFEMIPRNIIETYSSLIRESEAKLVVAEANSFRQEANPGTQYIIPLHKIPSPEKISAFNFWLEAFDYARLQGPRMLAALLLIIPDDQYDVKAKKARSKLLDDLKRHS